MAHEVYSFQVTIPAGTAQTSPVTTNIAIPVRELVTLEITVPPGPMGFMGFAITMGKVNVIPIQPGTYIVTDDRHISWPLSGYPNSGAFQVTGYNTDVFDHSVYLELLADPVAPPARQSAVGVASLAALSNG